MECENDDVEKRLDCISGWCRGLEIAKRGCSIYEVVDSAENLYHWIDDTNNCIDCLSMLLESPYLSGRKYGLGGENPEN